jgi:hypothetical protein
LLKKYADVFALSLANMFGVDTNIVVYELLLILGGRPMKQKLRIIKPQILIKVKEEVYK